MNRNSFKLGVGLMSLAIGAGIGPVAGAQGRESSPARMATGSQLAFELAMAQAAATDVSAARSPAPQPAAPVATETTPGPDGLTKGAAFVQSETLTTADKDTIVARGNVEMRQNDRLIRADTVTHNDKTGVTTAEGHTQTINADGSVQYSDRITYDDENQSGVSENFAAIAADNTKVFARRVERVNDYTTRLSNIIYTPCQLCQKNGVTQEPSWSIQASEITQRKDKRMVYYNNAVVKLKGVPVLYMPYMWSPDPELERASGFLQPDVQSTRKRGGFSYQQPYLWSISPSSYLIVSPQLNAGINPLIALEYARHFYSGKLRARFGFTNEAFFDNAGERIGDAETRDYLLADGEFTINPDWRWNFTAQHIKDKSGFLDGNGRPYDNANFFERYDVDDVYEDNVGEWQAEHRQLVNQAHLIRQTPNSYLQFSIANYQSLAVGGYLDRITGGAPDPVRYPNGISDYPIAVNSDVYPVIAPMLQGYWSPEQRVLGGQLTLSVNALALQHKLYTGAGAPAFFQQPGVLPAPYDTARVSGGASWYGNMTTRGGLRWGPFFDYRHDQYTVSHLDAAGREESISRDLGTVGFNFSYPMVRKFEHFTAVLEPIAQLAASPEHQTSPYLPSEDSQSFEFDATTLFQANKSPGFDVYEGGTRLSLGLRSQLRFNSGFKAQAMVGRVLRDAPENQFLNTVQARFNGTTNAYEQYSYFNGVPEAAPPAGYVQRSYDISGLGTKSSDWVVDASFDNSKGLYGYTRMRLDTDSFRLAQGEVGLSAFTTNTTATLRYVFNDVMIQPTLDADGKLKRFGDNYRNLQLYARHFFTKNWGVAARLDRDLVENQWRRSTVSAIYRDDCIWYELVYQRNDTVLTRLNGKPQSSLFFRLNLATLGKSGADFSNVR